MRADVDGLGMLILICIYNICKCSVQQQIASRYIVSYKQFFSKIQRN